MSMQTITVNGIKISYNSNVKKKSTESNIPLADDGLSLMIQATEAYVESGYQIKALEAIGAFSTEAAPELLKKVGNGVKAAIEKIKEFFIKIGQYIKRMFLSTVFKTQATVVYNRLKKGGIREDWKEVKVAGCGNITVGLNVVKSINGDLAAFKGIDNEVDLNYGKVEADARKFLESKGNEATVGSLVSNPENEIVGQLAQLSSNSGDLLKGFKLFSSISDKCAMELGKISKASGADYDYTETAKKARRCQEVTNICVKAYTGTCKSIIGIGKAIYKKAGSEKKEGTPAA